MNHLLGIYLEASILCICALVRKYSIGLMMKFMDHLGQHFTTEPLLIRRNKRWKVHDASLHAGGASSLAHTFEHSQDSPSASLNISVSPIEAAEEVDITVNETAREDPSAEASPINDSEASAEVIPEDVLLQYFSSADIVPSPSSSVGVHEEPMIRKCNAKAINHRYTYVPYRKDDFLRRSKPYLNLPNQNTSNYLCKFSYPSVNSKFIIPGFELVSGPGLGEIWVDPKLGKEDGGPIVTYRTFGSRFKSLGVCRIAKHNIKQLLKHFTSS
ncbi:hypothetical protein RND71_009605 [Anisodus tanguticus]|uniref:Uncharacterized protein n=1 Tax=Anisodus tanguticus TaxID=243964 RepID=A0AAE1SI35_9SOLA|nr:hypothetical protein RND71_009605 [Anisodus tanguticus]